MSKAPYLILARRFVGSRAATLLLLVVWIGAASMVASLVARAHPRIEGRTAAATVQATAVGEWTHCGNLTARTRPLHPPKGVSHKLRRGGSSEPGQPPAEIADGFVVEFGPVAVADSDHPVLPGSRFVLRALPARAPPSFAIFA